MQLADKITKPEDLLTIDSVINSAFFKECENLYGPLDDNTFWKYREHLRKIYEYQEINIKGKPFHFVHFNKKDPNLIAYTADDKIGKKDGKVYIKPGKYLAQHTALSNEQIKIVVTEYKHKFVPPEIFYATSAEDAALVYENGPNSCMRGKDWKIENHPCQVYFGPDTKLAYVKNKSGDGISARTVIRTDRNPPEYIKIYGDDVLMQKALKAKDIKQATDGLKGARFPMLWHPGQKDKLLIMPYMDGDRKFAFASVDRNNREYMTVGDLPSRDGQMYLQVSCLPTAGYVVMPDVKKCERCGEYEFEESILQISRSDICPTCAEETSYIIINESLEGIENRVWERVISDNPKLYPKYKDKYYTSVGLERLKLWYDSEDDKVVTISGTEIDRETGNRYLKKDLLPLQTEEGVEYFLRQNRGNLFMLLFDPKTISFYTDRAAEKNNNIIENRLVAFKDFLLSELATIKKQHTSGKSETIKDIVKFKYPKLNRAQHEVLRLYLEHTNDGNSYIG